MRVLLDGRRLTRPQLRGGIDASWCQLVPALVELGQPDLSFHLLTASAYPWRLGQLSRLAARGATIHHHWASASVLANLGRMGLRTEWLGPGKCDLLHLSHPRWFMPTRARTIVSVQSLLHHDHPQLYRAKQVARLEDGFQGMADSASYWICASQGTREELIRLYRIPRGRTTVIYQGTTAGFFDAYRNAAGIARIQGELGLEKKPYLLFLGTLEPRKNIKNLMQAYELALEQGLTFDLVLAGPRGWRSGQIMEACQARPKFRGRLHFPGFLPQDQLIHLVAGALAFVHPARHEGTAMTALEAMAAGTPVLCSNRGALPEITDGAALLFEPNDPHSIARTMLQIQEDGALHARLRSQGLARAAAFTWQRCAQETMAAYRKAMELPR
jgi:glycosyltransferase involved in cell wall biosynthesis